MITSMQIAEWLKAQKKDRVWLAERCAVSKGTVDQWFSRGFSDQAQATIRMLMNATMGPEDETALIQFSAGEFEKIDKARRGLGYAERPPFYRDAILDYVEQWEQSSKKTLPFLPAELAAEVTNPPPVTEERQPVVYEAAKRGRKQP